MNWGIVIAEFNWKAGGGLVIVIGKAGTMEAGSLGAGSRFEVDGESR